MLMLYAAQSPRHCKPPVCERPCRRYLLCAVGAVYIRSMEAPARDILRDLVEMCKGVRHLTPHYHLFSSLVMQTASPLLGRVTRQRGFRPWTFYCLLLAADNACRAGTALEGRIPFSQQVRSRGIESE